MFLIAEKDIQKHYLMSDAIKDVCIGLFSKKKNSLKIRIELLLNILSTMPLLCICLVVDLANEIASIKIASIFPRNVELNKPTTQAVLVLTDTTNSEHLCMMNASYLTRLRTGALSGIATKQLSRENSIHLGVIGTGGMAFEQGLGTLKVRNIQKKYLIEQI